MISRKLQILNCVCFKLCWNGWLATLCRLFCRETLSFTYMLHLVVELVESAILAKIISRKLQILNCVCCKLCWNGWLATHCWLFCRETLSFTYMLHLVVELVESAILAKIISRKLQILNYVCCKLCWNGWLATHCWLFCRETLSFTYMLHLVVELVEWLILAKIIFRKLQILKCVCYKLCWNGWLATLCRLFCRETLSLT